MAAAVPIAQGAFSLMGAMSANSAASAEARGHEYSAKVHDLRSKQISATARADLSAKLGAISAARAAKGVNDTSPTALALRKAVRDEALTAESRDMLSERFGIMTSNYAAYNARRRGQSALYQGLGSAIGSFGRAYADGKA